MVFKFLHQIRQLKVDLSGLKFVAISGITVASALVGVQQFGWLQGLETRSFDQMVRLRPAQAPDSRLLIVGVTDEDFARYRFPLPDQVVAQSLQQLQQYHPNLIGLDFYRDFPQPPGTDALKTQLQAENVVVITKLGNKEDPLGVNPPPDIPPERIGFNDVVTDPDGIVRRNLLFADISPTETASSFSLQLALIYLGKKNIMPQPNETNPFQIQWGKALFTPLEPNSGGYQKIGAEGYQVLLNYRTPKNVARRITLTQLLNGDFDPSWVKDKIVLIGPTALSSKDFFFTPYSSAEQETARMFGIEIHAQMVSHLLDAVEGERPLFWYWTPLHLKLAPSGALAKVDIEWLEILWVIGWAFAGGAVAWYLRHPLVLGLGGVTLVGSLFGICFAVFLRSGWIPLAAPALAATITGGAVVAYRAQQSQRQQQMVMTLLGQNTSPEIADALWNSRDRLIKSGKLPGQSITATMLFTDIKDFSTISELMAPEDLLEWLNEYLSAMTQEIQLQHGIVNKFIGDGIMAVFGVPMARTTREEIAADARHAVLAALALGTRLDQLNGEWQQQQLPVIKMRAGIFTGEVVVGSLGGKDRMEYGVIGDSVNIASRLESCDKHRHGDSCRVLIARETLEYIKDEFEVEAWGPMALKGRHQLIEVYRVVRHLAPGSLTVTVPQSVGSIAPP